jgi:hypothetical protein
MDQVLHGINDYTSQMEPTEEQESKFDLYLDKGDLLRNKLNKLKN